MHLRKAFSLVLAAGLVAGCESATTTQPDLGPQLAKGGNGIVAKATGSGVRAGSIRHFQFTAIQKAGGSVSGQFNLTFEGSGNPRIHGEAVCIRVEDNRAWVGVTLTQASNEAWVGTEGGYYVEDHGEGQGTADRLSLLAINRPPGYAQAVCDVPFVFGAVDIEKGNIQVH